MVSKLQQEVLSNEICFLKKIAPQCAEVVAQWTQFYCNLALDRIETALKKQDLISASQDRFEKTIYNCEVKLNELNDKITYLSSIVERHIQSHIKLEKK
jgi:hypothetical protein